MIGDEQFINLTIIIDEAEKRFDSMIERRAFIIGASFGYGVCKPELQALKKQMEELPEVELDRVKALTNQKIDWEKVWNSLDLWSETGWSATNPPYRKKIEELIEEQLCK